MEMTGSQIFFKCLEREGVRHIFGYPGGTIIDLYDELLRSPQIKHYLVRHEQAAVHAADGYARATGNAGVVLVTSGPGATNTVSGIANAFMDSCPIVVFTGQAPTSLIGKMAFQEVDIVDITRPITKQSYQVRDIKDLAWIIGEAFYIAQSERPGPVLVDLPKDVIHGSTTPKFPEVNRFKDYTPQCLANPHQVQRALQLILEADRPIIYIGGGLILSDASEELYKFAEALQIPVTSTLMGLGGFPGDHPLSLGMLGMHGAFYSNKAMNHADVIIAIGARFDDRVTGELEKFAPQAKIIHIDIDPKDISKNVVAHIPIVGDCQETLIYLNELLRNEKPRDWASLRKPWMDTIREWETKQPLGYETSPEVIKPQYVVEKLYELTKGEAYITTEVGQHQMWAVQYYKFTKPRRLITSGGLGIMGYGLPAALGVQVAKPDDLVIDIAGDGSIQMVFHTLATVVENHLPIKVAILNNGCLGMVRQWQELFYDRRYSETRFLVEPDYVKLAEAFGALGLRAEKPAEVEPVIRQALDAPGPVVMDFRVDPDECVYPMVPAGKAIDEMILPGH
jgi:acetolactate synthase-1/2/3 large subunit